MTNESEERTSLYTNLSKCSISDLAIFLEVVRVRSVREVARSQNIEPGHISRLVRRFERRVGAPLFVRSISGMTVTPAGASVEKSARRIMDEIGEIAKFAAGTGGSTTGEVRALNFAAISYLATHVLSPSLNQVVGEYPNLRGQIVELAPDQFVRAAIRGAFEVALHIGEMDWPRTWQSKKIGEVRCGLYARKRHPRIKRQAKVSDIKKETFVYPLYWSDGVLVEGRDSCPLSLRLRKRGCGTSTAESAMEITASSEHLSFLPDLITLEKQELDLIQKVHVEEWGVVSQSVYLSVRADSVPDKLYKSLQEVLNSRLR